MASEEREESQPSLQLPLISETGQASAPADAAPTIPTTDEDVDEEDLFGSEDEMAPAPAGAARTVPTIAPSGSLAADDEKDLFGDDNDAKDLDEKDLFGSDNESAMMDEKELFGSDEEKDKTAPSVLPQPQPDTPGGVSAPGSVPGSISTLDEREIFGEISDEEEPEKVEEVILRRRPAPSSERRFKSLRLPNIMTVEKTAYNRANVQQSILQGYKQGTNSRGEKFVKLVSPANCVRWRFKKGADGQNLTDEDGRPQYESNAKIVEREDGSRTMHIGSESFPMSEIQDQVYLFEENSQDVHVLHGLASSRLVVTPLNLKSNTHDMLKRSQYRTYRATRRTLLTTPEEQDQSRQLYELEMEQKKRQAAKQKRNLEPAPEAEITAAFLEDDNPGAGPSVLDVKRQYRKPEAAKKAKLG